MPNPTPIDNLAREALEQAERATPGPWGSFGMGLYAGGGGNVAHAKELAIFQTRDSEGRPRTWDLDLCVTARAREPRLAAFALEAVEALRRVAEFYAGARALLAKHGVDTST